jgi:hypothetical protein
VRLREDYDRFTRTRPQPLTPAQQQAITALAADIEGLWAAPTTTDADRKQLIRALVDQVTITVAGTSERVAVKIGWAGGHTTHGQTIRPVARLDQLSSYPQLLERVRQLAEQGHRARAIADRLHAEGFRPAKGRQRIGGSAITQLLHQLGDPRAFTRARIVPPPGEEPGPTSGGWTTWPPSSPCRPSPRTPRSAAAGSAPARSPAAPTAGSSTPMAASSPSFASADPARLAGTPADAGPTHRPSPGWEPRSCQLASASARWLTHLHPPSGSRQPEPGPPAGSGPPAKSGGQVRRPPHWPLCLAC